MTPKFNLMSHFSSCYEKLSVNLQVFNDTGLTEEKCPLTQRLEGRSVDEKKKREKENEAVFKRTRLWSDAI